MKNYKTISELFYHVIENNKSKNIFNYKENNKWVSLTGKEIYNIVESIICGLRKFNIGNADKVAILSSTNHKWALCDYGIICNGSTTVTVYPTLLDDQIKYILNNSDSKIVFVENKEQFEKITKIFNNCPLLEVVIVMDNSLNDLQSDKFKNLELFLKEGLAFLESNKINIENISNNIKPDDLVTLIYTSGTTGTPKGVMLSHNNLISNINGVNEIQKKYISNEKFLSFLPLSHVLERMAGHFYSLSISSEIYYAENMETVGQNMLEVSPTIVICVPRFFEKMYDKIMDGLNSSSPLKIKMFNWALKVGKDMTNLNHANQKATLSLTLKYKIAEKLIYSKVRNKLGGKIKFFISGGAPLSRNVAEFFSGIGVTILEGYGLTETSPVLTSNTPEEIRFGCVGKSLNNVQIKIANDGEILAKGPNIMLGYYKDEESTKNVIDSDGWFATGDIGEFDEDGFLKITDRKKSLLVTSAGKNIAPAPLENALISSKYIDQVLVIGDQRNFISALIVPSYNNINNFLLSINKDKLSNNAIVDHPAVLELISDEIKYRMNKFSKFETIKKFKLSNRPFTIERGEMTPKMSIVRKKVIENFSDLIDSIYK